MRSHIDDGPTCYVQYVDGAEVSGFWERAYDVFPELQLAAGEHRLSVGMRHRGFFDTAVSLQNCLIVLPTVAGHAYEVHCEIAENAWRAWARDTAGGVEDVPCMFLPLNTAAP